MGAFGGSGRNSVEAADVRKRVVSGKRGGGGHLYVFVATYRGNRYIECLILDSVRSVEPGVGEIRRQCRSG